MSLKQKEWYNPARALAWLVFVPATIAVIGWQGYTHQAWFDAHGDLMATIAAWLVYGVIGLVVLAFFTTLVIIPSYMGIVNHYDKKQKGGRGRYDVGNRRKRSDY